jgi:hypothetical protein
MMELSQWTRDDVSRAEPAQLLYEEPIVHAGRPVGTFTIRRGSVACCAYIDCSAGHPLAHEHFEPYVHGGVTFDNVAYWNPQRWAWGWDYGHVGDDLIFDPDTEQALHEVRDPRAAAPVWAKEIFANDRTWLPVDVRTDSEGAICEFVAAYLRAEEWVRLRAIARRLGFRSRPARFNTMGRFISKHPVRVMPPTWEEKMADLRKLAKEMRLDRPR